MILIAGILLFMIGLLAIIPLFYALIISIGIYFGIKIVASRRKKALEQKIGRDYCAKCGKKITGKKCSKCDTP